MLSIVTRCSSVTCQSSVTHHISVTRHNSVTHHRLVTQLYLVAIRVLQLFCLKLLFLSMELLHIDNTHQGVSQEHLFFIATATHSTVDSIGLSVDPQSYSVVCYHAAIYFTCLQI